MFAIQTKGSTMKLDSGRVRCSLQSQRKFWHPFQQSLSLSPVPETAFKRTAYATRTCSDFLKVGDCASCADDWYSAVLQKSCAYCGMGIGSGGWGICLTLNIPSLARQRCLSSWGPRRTPWFFFVISQLFDAVDYSNYVFWVSETIIQ